MMDTNSQLPTLPGKLLRVMDEERRRLARDFHDDLSQQIAHVAFDLERLAMRLPRSRQVILERLEAIRGGITEFSESLRRTAHRLHPAMLEHLDFATVILSYAAEFFERTGVFVKVKCMGVPPSLPPELRSSLFSIVREALNNVYKHAGPGAAATVTIGSNNSTLVLRIEDNGRGFEAEGMPMSHGLGLISIRERVRILNGSSSIDSVAGGGVSIDIVVPTGMP